MVKNVHDQQPDELSAHCSVRCCSSPPRSPRLPSSLWACPFYQQHFTPSNPLMDPSYWTQVGRGFAYKDLIQRLVWNISKFCSVVLGYNELTRQQKYLSRERGIGEIAALVTEMNEQCGRSSEAECPGRRGPVRFRRASGRGCRLFSWIRKGSWGAE